MTFFIKMNPLQQYIELSEWIQIFDVIMQRLLYVFT